MSIFGKLFKHRDPAPQKSEAAAPSSEAAPAPSSDPATDPNLIRVFDQYGQEVFISKDEWRKSVLPGSLKKHWNDSEQLSEVIIRALHDGFETDVLAAAQQLYRIDPDSVRSACVLGIVLMKNDRLDEAEKVLRSFIENHNEDGSVLTNLAKVYSARGEKELAEATLWHGLEVDPNQENGLAWYEAITRERSGDAGALGSLRRVAELPGSWRAQVWLARAALKSKNLDQALRFYRESLNRMGPNIPTDMLIQMSGDLGNHGQLPELLELTEPHFVSEVHGLQVGNNLIKAHLELGQLDAARRILDELYSLKRPDWRETLGYWDTELAKARLATTDKPSEPLSMSMLLIEGPVWLKPDSPALKLFQPIAPESPVISFLGSTATIASPGTEIQPQLSDDPGRLSRELPLFLAEQLRFAFSANVQTLIPWLVSNGGGGFVLGGIAWTDEDALQYVSTTGRKSDYLVISHLNTVTDQWSATLRALRVSNGEFLGKLEISFGALNHGAKLKELSRQLATLFTQQTGNRTQSLDQSYQLPSAPNMASYLLRLEQLLAVRCASMDGMSPGFLNGEREIVEGNLYLCLACPENVPVRILFAQTLLAMNRIRPDVVREITDKVALLQKEKPLTGPAQSVVQNMLREIIDQ